MSVVAKKLTECAACGIPIVQPKTGSLKEFCSETCKKTGRAFCKTCGKPIEQPARPSGCRKIYCDTLCRARYRSIGGITQTWLEERNRTECIVCGAPIEQSKYNKRKYCSKRCGDRYTRTGRTDKTLIEEWGAFGPETRKSLREVQQFIGTGAAKRLATAIDREYVRRKKH